MPWLAAPLEYILLLYINFVSELSPFVEIARYKGSSRLPKLDSSNWVQTDGSLSAIAGHITRAIAVDLW